jgi:C-terminal processing protease CtpA/Prc
VINLIRGSSAERAGLRNDDVVVEFDGTPVAQMNPGLFRAAVARETPTKVVVKRGSEQLTFSITPYIAP